MRPYAHTSILPHDFKPLFPYFPRRTVVTNILCAIAAFAVLVCTCSQASAAVSLSAGEGIYGMVTRPLSPGQPIDPVTLKLTGSGSVTLSAVDIFDRPVAWKQTVTLAADVPQTVPFSPPSLGFYHLAATVDEKEEAGLDLGIAPQATIGLSYSGQLAGSTQDQSEEESTASPASPSAPPSDAACSLPIGTAQTRSSR